MAQIVPRETISERLGAGLATGISSGLQALAQQRMQQMQQRQLANAYQSVGLPQELAYLPENIVKSFLERGGAGALAPQEAMQPQQFAQEIPQEAVAQPQGLEALQALQQQYAQPLSNQQALQQILQGGAAAASPFVRQAIAQAKPDVAQVASPAAISQAASQPAARKPSFAEVLSQPTPREKREIETLELKKQALREKSETKKQKAIDESNSPFLTQLNKAVPVAEEMSDKANEMLKLLDTGKVASGILGATATAGLNVPGVGSSLVMPFLNDESQRFLALSNDIAALLAANSGVATGFKIKFAERRKPNLSQNKGSQRELTRDIIKQANKILERERISNELISLNNYQQPPNLKSQVDKIYQSSKKLQIPENLPNPAEYSKDAIIEINGKQYEKRDNQWVPYKG